MARYLPVKTSGRASIAICPRCSFKVYYDDLVQDPNNKLWVCKDCADVFDPWRLPSRLPENISLDHPRPEEPLTYVYPSSLIRLEQDDVDLSTEDFEDLEV